SAAYDRYAYVKNNPVKYTDPSGHRVSCGDGGAGVCGGDTLDFLVDEYYGKHISEAEYLKRASKVVTKRAHYGNMYKDFMLPTPKTISVVNMQVEKVANFANYSITTFNPITIYST